MNQSVPVLRVTGLTKTFPAGRGRAVALRDVSFELARGGSLGIVGESGSGKSTLVRMVAALERPDSGRIEFGGVPLARPVRGRKARLARARQVQMVFQDPYTSLDPRMRAGDAVRYALRLHGTTARDELDRRTTDLLSSVGLGEEHADALPHRLSGGQRQRVAIARALAADPDVLILDESVSALDVSVQAQILQLLDRLRAERQVAYLFVSHDLAVVEAVTADVLVLRAGELVERGTTAQVLAAPQAPYTRMLLASTPRPGWQPALVGDLRRSLDSPGMA